MGLNLVRTSPENGGMTNGGVKIKQELEDIKYDVIHQQQSSDAMMLIAAVGGPAAGVTSGILHNTFYQPIAKKYGIHLYYKFVLKTSYCQWFDYLRFPCVALWQCKLYIISAYKAVFESTTTCHTIK